jgi:hypothetical protein
MTLSPNVTFAGPPAIITITVPTQVAIFYSYSVKTVERNLITAAAMLVKK